MQDALLANLKASEGGPQKLAVIVGVLQDYYRERLRATLRSDSLLAERAYDRASAILLEHARSGRLEFDTLQTAFGALEAELDSEWKDKYFNLGGRIRVRTELVKLAEARRGAEHPATATALHDLASVLAPVSSCTRWRGRPPSGRARSGETASAPSTQVPRPHKYTSGLVTQRSG